MDSIDGTVIVNLTKRRKGGVGFLACNTGPYLTVSHVVKGGVAHETGFIEKGDVILEVNGKSLEKVPYLKALEILDLAPIGEIMALKIRAQDGFQAELETVFDSEGVVRTVRRTRQSPKSAPSTVENEKMKNEKNMDAKTNGEKSEPSELVSLRESKGGTVTNTLPNAKMSSKCLEVVHENVNGEKQEQETTKGERLTLNGADDVKKELEKEQGTLKEKKTTLHGSDETNNKNDDPGKGRSVSNESVGINKCPVTHAKSLYQQPKYVKLQNLLSNTFTTDTLHQKAIEPLHCSSDRCLGSLMQPYGAFPKRQYGVPRAPEEVKLHANDFLQQYYDSMKLQDSPAYHQRLAEVLKDIEETGTYELAEKELIFGCRLAWRNASRCIGRIQWNKLHVFDARGVNTPAEMFEALCKHIKYGTNKGNIRSTITIFPQRKRPFKDFRVWNSQLIRYAGYKQSDGSVIGDPANVEFTEICVQLGWEGKGGNFDVLPLVLQAHGEDPEMFEIPPEIVLEVEMKHPKYPWFEEFGLRWYALPAVSCLMLDVGGVEFPACPFNGWYMVTEIGARDFGDPCRYNMLEPVAKRMGLDTKSPTSLWKDFAMVEINLAVLHSFQEASVTIIDHHSCSDSFLKHVENEVKFRGGCPGDWVWIVPPMSGSATGVFHQEMLNYYLKPSYEYQDDPWKHHKFQKGQADDGLKKKTTSFKEVAKVVKFTAKMMSKALAKRQKAVILYATETGKSERYAKMLGELFSYVFDPKVMCMEEYSYPDIENEQLVLIVTSTFGNGDPPENGEGFARYLYELRHPSDSVETSHKKLWQLSSLLIQKERQKLLNLKNDSQPLANLRYSVFGLGSKAYPNFCAFARSLDNIIQELGGEPVLKMGEGDELCGQEEAFKVWAKAVFQAACDSFCINDEVTKEATDSMDSVQSGWVPGRFRLTKATPANDGKTEQLTEGLSHICGKTVRTATLMSVKNLQSTDSSRSTILVKFKTNDHAELQYRPGDHVAIFPANHPDLVQTLIDKLSGDVDPDAPIAIETLRETKGNGLFGKSKEWETFARLPSPITIREALARYLDITSVPSPQLIQFLASIATIAEDKEILQVLAEGKNQYEDWKFENECNILEVLQEHCSLSVPADLLLTQLPLMQPRFYSISSSPDLCPGEIHLTVAVVHYNKKGGKGPLHRGVCSTWLNRLQPGDEIPCYVRQAHTFHMPEDTTVPIIMVGPGTGLAPFRSFWQQRQYDITNKGHYGRRDSGVSESSPQQPDLDTATIKCLSPAVNKLGSMSLFFGCRNSKQDCIHKDEMLKAKDEGVLTEIFFAFSREPDAPKKYVQDMLKEEAFDICEKLLSKQAHFYVCGDVKMADDVCKTLQTLLQEYAAMSQGEAQETVDKLKSTGRYHEDIFGVTLKTREVTTRIRSAVKRSLHLLFIKNPKKVMHRSDTTIDSNANPTRENKAEVRLKRAASAFY
ncbi:nitric oxide synthase 3-like isoform X3 [Acropora palmata]